MNRRDREQFRDLLAQSPGLWALCLVVAEVGTDKAVDTCQDPATMSPKAAGKLRAAQYPLMGSLPTYEDILAILMGIRLQTQMRPQRGKNQVLQTVARDLGMDLAQARVCLRTLQAHQTTPGFATFLHEAVANEVIG